MSELAAQHERWADARDRLWPARRQRPVIAPPAPVAMMVFPVLPPRLNGGPLWKRIAVEVAKMHGVTFEDIVGRSRHKLIVLARNEAMYRVRNEVTIKGRPISFPEIARLFGREHTTVLHSYRNHTRQVRVGAPE